MKTNLFRTFMMVSLLLIFVLGNLTGCNSGLSTLLISTPTSSNTLSPFTETVPNIPTSTTSQSTSTPMPAETSTLVPLTPTETTPLTVYMTPIVPGLITNDLLIYVERLSRPSASLWILPSGAVVPHVLLSDPRYSYEIPNWSNDGEWIAFRQRDYGRNVDRIGIISKNGSDKMVFDEEFGTIGRLKWSSDDRKLVFDAFSPFMINIQTGESTNLLPDYENLFSNIWLEPSPKQNRVALIGNIDGSHSTMKLWLLSLDGASPENIPLPIEVMQYCTSGIAALHPLEWSPDGQSLLVQFGEWPTNDCGPQLWLYNIPNQEWHNVIRLSEGTYAYITEGAIHWSKDGSWVSWSTIDNLLIYAVNENWKVARMTKLHSFESLMVSPWFNDDNGDSILFISRDISVSGTKVEVVGLSPNGTKEDDRVVVRIENEPPWLPNDTYFIPWMWRYH